MNEVRRTRELDAAGDQCVVAAVDVAHAQIEYRFLPRRGCFLEKEARASTIEEGKLPETVEVLQSEHVTISSSCVLDVLHRTRDLPDWSELESRIHGFAPLKKRTVVRHAAPTLERGSAVETELGYDVRRVKFDRVQADPEATGDLPVAQAVTQELDHSPFRRRQHVWMWRASFCRGHEQSLAPLLRIYPPPTCSRPVRAVRCEAQCLRR
jgi:hypothetical protein